LRSQFGREIRRDLSVRSKQSHAPDRQSRAVNRTELPVECCLLRLPRPSREGEGMTKRLGIAIDQNRCIGCWTCSVACKSINNEPLGIHWNRILTSRPNENAPAREQSTHAIDVPTGEFPNVQLAYQPTSCQHCKNAPCEKVCPVGATFRRDDGAILVDFERCIGCRYCIAACPYGARSFTWGRGQYAPEFTVGYGQEHRTSVTMRFFDV
jgi:Fe-S-cluster-containing dehydrogenase component